MNWSSYKDWIGDEFTSFMLHWQRERERERGFSVCNVMCATLDTRISSLNF